MSRQFGDPADVMRYALELARSGEGFVEPNPMVGAVIVDDALHMLGAGCHERFGGPHAEVAALQEAGDKAAGATLFVTLEPCCHFGKTPPCTEALIRAGIRRVVVGISDPFPSVAGKGIARLRESGIEVQVGLLGEEVRTLCAPFLKLIEMGRPWVIAKWAMSLDGKIASHTGESRWISNARSREVVHRLRGRMDAVLVGVGTALHDDPLLTARPPGPRTATRIVLDSQARLPVDSQLVSTAGDTPVLIVVSDRAPIDNVRRLQNAGVEVLLLRQPAAGPHDRGVLLGPLLNELGKRGFTNVLVEGGGQILGSFFDSRYIDEVHVFIAPKLLGGKDAPTPIAGSGLPAPPALPQLDHPSIEQLDGDLHIHGRLININPGEMSG